MHYKLKSNIERKIKREIYYGSFIGFVIWLITLILNYKEGYLFFLLYFVSTAMLIVGIIYFITKKSLDDLSENISNAFIELKDEKIIYNHFANLDQFKVREIEIMYSDIVDKKIKYRRNGLHKIIIRLSTGTIINFEGFEQSDRIYQLIQCKA